MCLHNNRKLKQGHLVDETSMSHFSFLINIQSRDPRVKKRDNYWSQDTVRNGNQAQKFLKNQLLDPDFLKFMQKVWAETFRNLQPWKTNYEGLIKIVSTETTTVGRPASKENRISKSDNAMPPEGILN